MTSGARKARHRQRDDGFKTWTCCWCWWWWCWWWWCARGQSSDDNQDDTPPLFTDSERAQRWRRSLASLLFLTALLSDRLGPGAEARLTGSLDKVMSGNLGTGTGAGTGREPGILRSNEDTTFVGNSSGASARAWGPEKKTCAAKNCLTFVDADHLCRGLWGASEWNASAADLYLSFCDSYSLMDLLDGSSSPDRLNCSVDAMRAGGVGRCSLCVQAYQRYDLHAQEKYEEFELMTDRYVTDAYSVRTCMEECKMVYKPWLCAQYFQSNQSSCSRKVPCEQYCLDVQQRCPFILPDNDDLIHGGTPSFICTGLSETANAEQEPQCCDVRWKLNSSHRSRDTFKRTHPSCQHSSSVTTAAASASSGAPRLGQGRLKLCLLVLVLLHTVATMTASQNSTCLAGIFPLEDNNAPREE